MKKARDFIKQIHVNKANCEHIAASGIISGSLLIDFERALKLYAEQAVKHHLEKAKENVSDVVLSDDNLELSHECFEIIKDTITNTKIELP